MPIQFQPYSYVSMEPASANTGFYQLPPALKNQFLHDPSIKRVFELFLPANIARTVAPEITSLGDEVLQQHIFDWVTDAEKNQPYVTGSGRNAFGQPVNTKLVVTEGWRKLQDFSIQKGFVSQGYEIGLNQYTRIVQYLRELIFESSSANVGCPGAMSDGAARVLQHHLLNSKLSAEEQKVFRNAYDHLVSRDPTKAWTSGQWMTERIGGSDVSRSETVATYSPLPNDASHCDPEEGIPHGPWSIDGFKWFSSATDSNMTILLAQTPNGLSAFYAPMRRYNPSLVASATGSMGGMELNGVTISRLKNKMGTKSLPTAELQLRDMRGWLIGKEGHGIKEISTILTITRIRSAISALGYLSRGLTVARAFAEVREVGAGCGKRMRLVDSTLHMRTLADMAVEQHAMMLLTFYSSYLLGLKENPTSALAPPPAIAAVTPPSELVTPLLRVMTPLLKAYVTKQAIPLIYACMESLGGVGYLENVESEYMNVARLFRDACVLNIWEGTTDVLSTDLLRALKHPKEGPDSIKALNLIISYGRGDLQGAHVTTQWEALRTQLDANTQEGLLPDARGILWKLAEILMAVLFLLDVKNSDGPVIQEMCRRYFTSRGIKTSPAMSMGKDRRTLELDQAIIFGVEHTVAASKL
ncbi:very-long-chain acyl-CoA dehydrogenase [Xylaria flabelliformis]|nr:very-long-chain acyl-CoA dehydrogenase [Xylaria flabelliformis]